MTTLRIVLSLFALHVTSLASAQQAAPTPLTVEISQVRSGSGTVLVNLCEDAGAPLPGSCVRYRGVQPATAGITTVRIDGAGHFVFVGAPDRHLSLAAVSASGGALGGTPQANKTAWTDNRPRTLAFLEAAFAGKAR